MTASVVLCADDYGLHDAINAAILELAAGSRISAASAIVTGPNWLQDAPALSRQRNKIAIGLHLDLTSIAPIGKLVAGALARRLSLESIETSFERQFAFFEEAIGAPPDIIDGHQHIHALPQICDCLFEVLARRDPDRRLLLRAPADSARRAVARGTAVTKALVISALTSGFAKQAQQHGYVVNDSFAGISSFASDPNIVSFDYARAMKNRGTRPLVMCHPGQSVNGASTVFPHASRRAAEFAYLMSDNNVIRDIVSITRGIDGRIDWLGQGGWGTCRKR